MDISEGVAAEESKAANSDSDSDDDDQPRQNLNEDQHSDSGKIKTFMVHFFQRFFNLKNS